MSMPTTTHWEPNSSLRCLISVGFIKAGVLIEILSAPSLSISLASSKDLIPPATQNGILITFDIFCTQLLSTVLSSVLAEMS